MTRESYHEHNSEKVSKFDAICSLEMTKNLIF